MTDARGATCCRVHRPSALKTTTSAGTTLGLGPNFPLKATTMSPAAAAKTASPSSVITASGDAALFSRLQAGLEGALPNEARTSGAIAYSHG